MDSDPYAPRFHFTTPEGNALPFDPNGALYWKGRYHLFYIFQNHALPHEGHSWGHASSKDLLHWKFHPTALAPSEEYPEKGIFSGNAFISKEGIPTLAYYGIDAGICLAQSSDNDLNIWTRVPENPVIPQQKEGDAGWGVYNVFDPHIWLEDDIYYAILGGNIKPHEIRDTAYLFQSKDLVNWQYLRPFYAPNPDWTEPLEDCACPDFFKLGNRYVLLCISHSNGTRYYIGRYQNGTFIPEEHHRMNWPGGSCFASESLVDNTNRRIFWAWVIDQRKDTKDGVLISELGVMTLPRIMSSDSNGQILITPAAELEQLRKNQRDYNSIVIESKQNISLPGCSGDCIEIFLETIIPENGIFGINLRMSPDKEERTTIIIDTSDGFISIDTTKSALREDIFQPFPIFRLRGDFRENIQIQKAPFKFESIKHLQLHIFLDKSILEIFVNDRICLTQRIYPTRKDSLGIEFFSSRGKAELKKLSVWDMHTTNINS